MGPNILVSRPRPVCVTWRFPSREHLTSSVTWLFDSPGAISYRCSIVTESLSPTIFEIMDIFLYLGHDLDLFRSSDVIGHVTDRSAICHFLLVSHCNRTSISNHFRDIRPPIPVRTQTHTHTQTHRNTPQVILYSVPCNVLHWTDNYKERSWIYNKETTCVRFRLQVATTFEYKIVTFYIFEIWITIWFPVHIRNTSESLKDLFLHLAELKASMTVEKSNFWSKSLSMFNRDRLAVKLY